MEWFVNLYDFGEGALDFSLLILRIILAWVFWVHAWHKSFGKQGFRGSGDRFKFHKIPCPYLMAYFVSTSQLIGAPLILFGFLTRIVSLLFMFQMIVGAICKYKEDKWFNGADFPLALTGIFFVLFFLGAGTYSFDNFWVN
ncbi:MAG: DoxX family protein [Bacillota bacterium]